jgi:probable addiction module antidote protein
MAAIKVSNIKDQLYEDLKDPAYASAYINEAFLEGDETVLKTALADVIRARGVAAVARKAGINRVTVYKTLKPGTESSFTTMHALLRACNVSLQVLPTEKRAVKRGVKDGGLT